MRNLNVRMRSLRYGAVPMPTKALTKARKARLYVHFGLAEGQMIQVGPSPDQVVEIVDIALEMLPIDDCWSKAPRVMLVVDDGRRDAEDRAGVLKAAEIIDGSTVELNRI